MTPEERAALLARAATWGIPRAELAAAVAVLGASANRARMLRRAHAEVYRLRKEGGPLPFWLRVLEAEYQARVRKPKPGPAVRLRTPGGSLATASAIRDARERAGLSQEDLAALAGVTRRCVQGWEWAEYRPGEEHWVQLELTLGPLGVVREAGPETEAASEASSAA